MFPGRAPVYPTADGVYLAALSTSGGLTLMNKMTTTACAIALGLAWAAAPAMAQTTPQSKAEDKAQKIEQKGDQKADKLEQKADETRAKADEKADKVRTEGTTTDKAE